MRSTPAARSTPIPTRCPERNSRPASRGVHAGLALAPGERVLWQDRPSWRGLAVRAFHAPVLAGYFGLLVVARLAYAWAGHGALEAAMPPAMLGAATLAIVLLLAALAARATRYIVTDRRIVLRFGVGLPRSVSLPFGQIRALALAPTRGGRGDIAFALHDPGRLTYARLWPYARPWRLRAVEPMMRDVPQAGVLAARLTRALLSAERDRHRGPVTDRDPNEDQQSPTLARAQAFG